MKFVNPKEHPTDDLELQNTQCEVQPFSSQTKLPVVCVKHACKNYGIKKNSLVVLDGLNMTVPKGIIYGLLGASGCGKTTLLSCILGQKKLNSGEIWVLGRAPGTKTRNGSRLRIGYMPQETALYGDFTIHETFVFFGWITEINTKRIEERFEELTKLFMLPDGNQRIKNLSGGEQRRVSLAAALLHEPELLILDEPTVGTDPLLREAIWNHLIHICEDKNVTIIMTTHYIEEARRAQLIGLMRDGKLLAEESPEMLLIQHSGQTLEEVFIELSVAQDLKTNVSLEAGPSLSKYDESYRKLFNDESYESVRFDISDYFPSLRVNHMKALVWKNVLWWMRNIPALIFMTALPFLMIMCVCLSIGRYPREFPVAVVNYETNNTFECGSELTCNSKKLSCYYFRYLKEHSIVTKYYNSEEDARSSVLHGETYASFVVKHNFSDALETRIGYPLGTKQWDIESSNIDVFRDVFDKFIANYLQVRFYEGFQNLIEDYFTVCDWDSKAVKLPINIETPIYGVKFPSFVDFAIPGIFLSSFFVLAVLLSSCAMLVERNEASLDRSIVMGITGVELITGHMVCEFFIMATQAIISLTCAFEVFEMTQRGSIVLVTLLTLLTGLCGMCYGILLATVCVSDTGVNVTITGTIFPTLMLGGVLWPLEGAHYLLRPLGYFLPFTNAIESLRSVLQRNWGFSSESVYMGFVSLSIFLTSFKFN